MIRFIVILMDYPSSSMFKLSVYRTSLKTRWLDRLLKLKHDLTFSITPFYQVHQELMCECVALMMHSWTELLPLQHILLIYISLSPGEGTFVLHCQKVRKSVELFIFKLFAESKIKHCRVKRCFNYPR